MAEKILTVDNNQVLRFVVTQTSTSVNSATLKVELYAKPYIPPYSDYEKLFQQFYGKTDITSVDSSYVYTQRMWISKTLAGSWNKIGEWNSIVVNFIGSNSTRSFQIKVSGEFSYYALEEDDYSYLVTRTMSEQTFTFTISGRPYGYLSVSSKSFTIGATETMTISSAWTTSALTISGGSNSSGTAYSKTVSSSAGNGSYTWSPTVAELAPYIRNSSYGTFSIRWGGNTINVNVTVPEASTKPSISAVEVPSVSPSAPNKSLNYFVQNVDAIKSTITASGQYDATISKYEITIDGVTKSSTSTNILISDVQNGTGSISYTAKVTDSRGYTNTVTNTVTYYEYAQPSISNVTLYRGNSAGDADTGGTYACAKLSSSISPIDNQNLSTAILYYKVEGASSYTSVNLGNINYTTSGVILNAGNVWDIRYKYLAYVVIRDYRTEAIGTITDIPTADVIIDVRSDGKAVSIGEYCPSASQLPEGFHVKQSWMPVESYTGTLSGKPFTRWNMEYGPLTMTYVRYEYGDIECDDAWGNMYATSSPIPLPDFGVTYSQIPMVMIGITCNFANSLWALNPINPTVTSPGNGEFCSATRGTKRSCIVTVMAIGILNKEVS